MFDSITGATMSAKRVSQTYGASRSHSRELVARAAGYRDWHHLTKVVGKPDAPTCDLRSFKNGHWPRPMSDYAAANPAFRDLDSWDLAEIIIPEPTLARDLAEPLLAIARDELGRHGVPGWLSIRAVVPGAEGGRFLVATGRDRDGIREIDERLPIGGTVALDVTADGLAPRPPEHTEGELIRAAVASYAAAYRNDDLPPPVPADEVADGRHDGLYGVDVPTLRRAIERHGSPEAAQAALRSVISIPVFSTMLSTTHAEDHEEAGIRLTRRAGVARQATAYVSHGVLRWTIRFEGAVWDRSLHLNDRKRAGSIKVGDPVTSVCDHPWLKGGIITAVHDDGHVLRLETDHRRIRLDTAHLPEDQWIEHEPARLMLAGTDGIGPADNAVVSGFGVERDALLTSCWDGGRHFSVIRAPSGDPVVVMCLLDDYGHGLEVVKEYQGSGSFYATHLPQSFLDHCGPVSDKEDSFWRARILGLSDRGANGSVML